MADKTLATFRIEQEKWEAFKNAANADGTNASALLTEFVDKYLAGNRLEVEPTPTDTHIDTKAELSLDGIETRLYDIEARLDKVHPANLDNMEKRLEARIDEVRSQLEAQLESLRGKLKARLVR